MVTEPLFKISLQTKTKLKTISSLKESQVAGDGKGPEMLESYRQSE